MILCLLGTNPYDFSRLAAPVDRIAKKFQIETFIQLGYTKYTPVNCHYEKFIDKRLLDLYMKKASLVISQGGFGSLTDAIHLGKKTIGVPRRIDLKESQDDQSELVKYYDKKGYIVSCYDIDNLEDIVLGVLAGKFVFKKYFPESVFLVKDIIYSYISKSNKDNAK